MNIIATQKNPKNTPKQAPAASRRKHDETIMVVKRADLFGDTDNNAWHGLRRENLQTYLDCIRTHHTFRPRSLMETDPTYKQIIPYIVFTGDNKYFLMQRKALASEQRLRNKMSLGIGGHLRAEDIRLPDHAVSPNVSGSHDSTSATELDLFAWARREFHEEVLYDGNFDIRFFGIINDDSDDVGKVHVGLVLILTGTSPQISIKSEHKSGSLVSLNECSLIYDNLESWSKLVLTALKDEKTANAHSSIPA